MNFKDIDRVIIGLGNPGREYSGTRHNIGLHIVEALNAQCNGSFQAVSSLKSNVSEISIQGKRILAVIPQTYMNLSGEAVSALMRKCSLDSRQVLVVFDDLETAFGAYKICFGGGARGHNGIRSIHSKIETKDFYQLRIGIGRPAHSDIADYVLSRFDNGERDRLESLLPAIFDEMKKWAVAS